MRQVMDPEDNDFRCEEAVLAGHMDDQGFFNVDHDICNRGANELDMYGGLMFRSVPRAMMTVFQCMLSDACESPSGTPLVWHLWDSKGVVLVTGYVVVYIFVTFGLFNLILAIFVENTMAAAHNSEQKRTARKHQNSVRAAKKLKHLLTRIFTTADETGRNFLVQRNKSVGLMKYLDALKVHHNEPEDEPASHLSLRVDQSTFEEALDQEEVQALLEDLDVSCSTRDNIFEILDADGNGYLALNELAEGIMRLRGAPDKGDLVSSALMVRCLQKNMRRLEGTVTKNQTKMMEMLRQTTDSGNGILSYSRTQQIVSPVEPSEVDRAIHYL